MRHKLRENTRNFGDKQAQKGEKWGVSGASHDGSTCRVLDPIVCCFGWLIMKSDKIGIIRLEKVVGGHRLDPESICKVHRIPRYYSGRPVFDLVKQVYRVKKK